MCVCVNVVQCVCLCVCVCVCVCVCMCACACGACARTRLLPGGRCKLVFSDVCMYIPYSNKQQHNLQELHLLYSDSMCKSQFLQLN